MSVSRERLLVLGGTGFLGTALVERARAEGVASILAAARRPEAAARSGARPTVLDLERTDAIAARLDELSPDLVLGLAAMARPSDCEREPERARCVNAEAPAAVAAWCAARGRRFVHVSTDLVFAGEPPRPEGYREDDPVAPVHVYGRTKAEGEARVLAVSPEALVVRLPLLAGDSRGTGAGASDSLLRAARAGEVSKLFTDEWRTPLDVDDAARALLGLADDDVSGLLHLGGPERLTRHELGLSVLRAAGFDRDAIAAAVRPVTHGELPLDPPRPRDLTLDSTRALRRLDFPLRPFGLPRG